MSLYVEWTKRANYAAQLHRGLTIARGNGFVELCYRRVSLGFYR